MKRLLPTLLLCLPLSAFSSERYECTHAEAGSAQRVIEVHYQSQSAPVPCEVRYTKPSGSQSLWRAQNQAGYCEQKAQAFAAKQRDFGWSCQAIAPSNTSTQASAELSTEAVAEP